MKKNMIKNCIYCLISFTIPSRHPKTKKYCSLKCSIEARKLNADQKLIKAIERYHKYTIKNNTGCWGWTGPKEGSGYGHFKWISKYTKPHRASWIIYFGPIPKGMWVLHRCVGNRTCSNPKHLKLGDAKENYLDMIAQNPINGTFKKNQIPHNRKITEEIAKQIKKAIFNKELYRIIAEKFNTTKNVVKDIGRRKTWKHVSLEK